MGQNHSFKVWSIGLAALLLILGHGPAALAQGPEGAQQVAQFDADDAYDPFADYSEFDEAQEEEADINFFRHGRFLTIGLLGGIRGFTQGSSQIFKPGPAFGAYLSYFFDMRFALQFSYTNSSHSAYVQSSESGQAAGGTVSIETFQADIKYYLNTQNVSKGLGKINPYIIGGFSSVNRTISLDSTSAGSVPGYSKEGALGIDVGAGFEIPFFRNKMYFGAQAMYQFVNYPDANSQITFSNGSDYTGKYANGGLYNVMALVGINF